MSTVTASTPEKSNPFHEDVLPPRMSEEEYLAWHTNKLIEFVDGMLEELPMPSDLHQWIIGFLYRALWDNVSRSKLGKVRFAALRMKIRRAKYREPDLLFLRRENFARGGNEFWEFADFVVEVVSPHDPKRDYVTKRADYTELGIPEYWIVDPIDRKVTILHLVEGQYVTHAVVREGELAVSVTLEGFSVDVTQMFDVQD